MGTYLTPPMRQTFNHLPNVIYKIRPHYQQDCPLQCTQPCNYNNLSQQITSDHQRNCLVLILDHLQRFGYIETATHLQKEANPILNKFECADNMDLSQVVHDYEECYENKYGRKPRFSRRSSGIDETSGVTEKRGQSKGDGSSGGSLLTTMISGRRAPQQDASNSCRSESGQVTPDTTAAPTNVANYDLFTSATVTPLLSSDISSSPPSPLLIPVLTIAPETI
eukprot:15358025-Ditylum_brightwellii.AAC.1